MTRNQVRTALLSAVLTLLTGCDSPRERVQKEQAAATQEIGKAQQKVAKEVEEGINEISKADPEDRAEEKVEATKEIAKAEQKVDDEKIEATKEITDAEQDAGAGGTYTKE